MGNGFRSCNDPMWKTRRGRSRKCQRSWRSMPRGLFSPSTPRLRSFCTETDPVLWSRACFTLPAATAHQLERKHQAEQTVRCHQTTDGWLTAWRSVSLPHLFLLSLLQYPRASSSCFCIPFLSFCLQTPWRMRLSSHGHFTDLEVLHLSTVVSEMWNETHFATQQMERFIFPGLKWQNQN